MSGQSPFGGGPSTNVDLRMELFNKAIASTLEAY